MADRAAGRAPGETASPSFFQLLRADFGLRMEHRGWVIWYLIVEKALQAVLFLGIGAWILVSRHRIPRESLQLIEHFDLDEGRSLVRHTAFALLKNVSTMKTTGLILFGVGSILHALLEGVESVGLLMRRRWAEYLVVLATGFLIPLEVFELLKHATPVKGVVLVANIAICIYLVRQKQLFQFHREHDGDHI